MLTTRLPALSFDSSHFMWHWLFGAMASRILNVVILMSLKEGNLNIILVILQSYKIITNVITSIS